MNRTKCHIGLIILVLGFLSLPSFAVTHYIRTDGGTSVQCDGLYDLPVAGAVSNHCALSHPFYLVTNNTTSATFSWSFVGANGSTVSAGDVIQFRDTGPYYIGEQKNGLGIHWLSGSCNGAGPDCNFPRNIPANVSIKGVSAGSCHNSGHTALVNPTVWSGLNKIYFLISFDGSSGLTFECFELTQPDNCTTIGVTSTITNTVASGGVATYTYSHPGAGVGSPQQAVGEHIRVTGTTNGGGIFNVTDAVVTSVTCTGTGGACDVGTFTIALAGTVASAADTGTQKFQGECQYPGNNYVQQGIEIQATNSSTGPINLTLRDVSIHGIAGVALKGSHFNSTGTDVTNISDLYINGNGVAGFNSDNGNSGTCCESVGTINLSNIRSVWNGCVEVKPNGGTIGGNGYNYCTDQGFGNAGGDGIVMIATKGTWNWSDIYSGWNTQDGLDTLHMNDDLTANPTVNFNRVYAINNEGQSIKLGGGTVVLTNAVGITNCNTFKADSYPANPANWNAMLGLTCRASDAIAIAMNNGNHVTIENVTNITDQAVSWDFAPASGGNCTNGGGCVMTFKNNATFGFPQALSPGSGNSGGITVGTSVDPCGQAGSSCTNNSWYHIGGAGTTCPGDSNETSYVCTNPQFTAQSAIASFDPTITVSSPLRGAGVNLAGVTTDFNQYPRTNPPDIGAYQYGSGTPATPVAPALGMLF